jgi:3D (Asp-Asp-Asp) domain-containing protein
MKTNTKIEVISFLIVCLSFIGLIFLADWYRKVEVVRAEYAEGVFPDPCSLKDVICEKEPKTIQATVTAYNSTKEQTDNSPCIGAAGQICGVPNVVACPRRYELGTVVKIMEKNYTCLDRLSRRYDNRFDIFFDNDVDGALVWGVQTLEVTIYEQ